MTLIVFDLGGRMSNQSGIRMTIVKILTHKRW